MLRRALHSFPKVIGLLIAASFLSACNQPLLSEAEKQKLKKDPIDRDINLSRQEFKDTMRPHSEIPLHSTPGQHKYAHHDHKSGKLEYEPIVLAPDSPPNISSKLVSLSVTEDVPIRDVLVELARLASLELALDSNISGGVIMNVHDRPVNEVIELLADLASLRYSAEHGVLHVQKDTPYLVNYQVDYLNLVRSSKGSINVQTQVLSVETSSGSGSGGSSGGSSGGGGSSGDTKGLNSGSSNEVTTSYDGDLWASVEANVKSILHANIKNLSTADDNVEVQDSAGGGSTQQVSGQPGEANKIPATSFYAINRQAGMISVMANSKKQAEVKKYLEKVRQNLSAQVLIEAKLVEVSLNQEYAAGIDWGHLRGKGFITSVDTSPTALSAGSYFAGLLSSDLLSVSKNPSTPNKTTQALKLLEGFGTTRVLQNPRVSALNNQQAVLTFATNKPYFTVQGTLQNPVVSNNTTVAQPVSITSQLHTIPIGVILTLQPSINSETQEITMNIRPTISKEILGAAISDPAVQILSQSLSGTPIDSKIPVIEVREMDTILKLKSGEVMLLGGLIENLDSNSDAGLPFLSGIPLFGNLAKSVSKTTSLKETVILLQATIISPSGYYHPQDKAVYKQFAQDPRPLQF
ncbi:MAG: secretin N-terminal domain-containing protein [Proteobacteria bacterium]|nr:secretin N-terminal domain-containing protein [Pseudomonadota bacterium]